MHRQVIELDDVDGLLVYALGAQLLKTPGKGEEESSMMRMKDLCTN